MDACVSIVIPVYNAEAYVLRCLHSVQAQTHHDLDVILVDDGSTDGSQALCKAFCDGDSRFSLICAEHGGVSRTRNTGIANARGDYLMFIDGDDEVLPDMVEKYLQMAESSNADVVIGGIDIIRMEEHRSVVPPLNIINRRELAALLCTDSSGLFGYVPNKMYRMEALRTSGIRFDETMYCQEDLDFALRFYAAANTFALLDYSGYLYYQSPGKRTIDQNSLMKNRIAIYRIACDAGVSTEITQQYASDIKTSLVKLLLVLRKRRSIQKISEVQGLTEVLEIPTKDKPFVRLLVRLFAHERFGLIQMITAARRALQKILKH